MQTLIPAAYYSDPKIFAREQVELFARNWTCIGFTHDLKKNHDFITREVGGFPVVVQNFDGVLRAYLNVCTHRFNRIQTECKGNRNLQCMYHGWIFDHSGLPSAIPKRPRFDDMSAEKIKSLQLEAWDIATCGGLVFVRKGLEGKTLREYLGDAFGSVEAMTNSLGPAIDENVISVRANWKILVENTLESYHVHFIHPTTFSRLNAGDGVFEWQSPHSSWIAPLGQKFMARMQHFMPVFESRPFTTPGYLHQLIFPHLTIATTQGTSFSIQFFEPISPSETKLSSFVFQTRLDNISEGKASVVVALNSTVKDFNRAVFSEDKDVCEQVQIGTAVTSKVGILSDEELRVHHFQQHYRELIGL